MASIETPPDGNFVLANLDLSPGEYHIVATSSGLLGSETFEVGMPDSSASGAGTHELSLRIHLEPTYTAPRPGGHGGGGTETAPRPPSHAPPPEENFTRVSVFFGTNRKPTGNPNPERFFGKARDSLHLGIAEVSIPRDHRMGKLEQPFLKFIFHEDPSRHVVLLSVKPLVPTEFFTRLASSVDEADKHEAMVFVHGFNVSFTDATRRTAQVAYDLGFEGIPICYSWPSRESVPGYPADEATVRATYPVLAHFLEGIVREPGVERIHVIAHSMGCQLVSLALERMARDLPQLTAQKVQEVILTAPDIDADEFRGLASGLERACHRITLYASSHDRALQASDQFQHSPRAGEAGAHILVLRGLDTVDASDVDTGLIGHSYPTDRSKVLADIFQLIEEHKEPSIRLGLERIPFSDLAYWHIRP